MKIQLTPREREVADLVKDNFPNFHIMQKLEMSKDNLTYIMGRLYLKYGLTKESSGNKRLLLIQKLRKEGEQLKLFKQEGKNNNG